MQTLPERFDSTAEFSTALQQQGWEAEFRQLDRGNDNLQARVAAQPEVALIDVTFSNRLHQLVLPPADSLTFGLPSRHQAPGLIGRRPLHSESINCFDPRQGMAAVSPAGFSAYTILANRERIECLMESTGLTRPVDQRYLGSARANRLRAFIAAAMPTMDAPDGKLAANAAQDVGSDLLLEVLQAYSSGEPLAYVPAHNRHRALRRALAYIEAHSQRSISVEELCRESAASISTLERAFRDHFGISPKRYLVACRMTRVRCILSAGVDQRSISDIAADWGFWHMSKFAADYKRMFGELPSATRQAA